MQQEPAFVGYVGARALPWRDHELLMRIVRTSVTLTLLLTCAATGTLRAQAPETPPPASEKEAVATAIADETEGVEAAAEAPAAAPAEPKRIAMLRPSGRYVDLPEMAFNPMSLLGGGGAPPKSFFQFLELVDGLAGQAGDEVMLDLSGGFAFNLPQLRELERSIARVHAAGKQITCYIEGAEMGAYQIAAMCDRVLMADMGAIDLRSPAMNVMHMKDALDLLGVQVEVTRVGDYKGAVEPYMLPTMSDHLRSHYRTMLDSMNADIVRRIAAGRKLAESKVRELQAQRLFTAKEALLAGLVDRLVPWAGAERALATARGDHDFELVDAAPKTKKKRKDLFAMLSDLVRGDKEEEIEDPQVVVLHLAGQIVDGDSSAAGSMVSGPSVRRIDSLADNDLVKGVVVRVNSPGGSATASEAIRQALQRLAAKKPVVFSMGELAASGGYWITTIGEPILAEVGTITGSIGVFGMRFQPGALMRRIGVHNEIVALDDGPLMDAMDRPWSETARSRMQGFVDEIYVRFLEHVAASRKKTTAEVDAIAGGRVWSGQQAVANGLVDRIGGVEDAVAMVRERAAIDGDVEVRHMPEPTNFADSLFSQLFDARIAAGVDADALRALLAECGRFGEVVAVLREAVAGDGKARVYALMPPGLRVQ